VENERCARCFRIPWDWTLQDWGYIPRRHHDPCDMGSTCVAGTARHRAIGQPSIPRLWGWWGGGRIEASTRCNRELSTCCTVLVQRMLLSHWYTSPTPSVEGACNVSRNAATTATLCSALVKVGSCHSAYSFTMVWPVVTPLVLL
jgi:hypothetical protein